MQIEVKIMPREDFNEDNLGWSLPVEIDEFILNPSDVEFKWEDGSTLPYNDFIFFGNEYYYGIFINGKNINELTGIYIDEGDYINGDKVVNITKDMFIKGQIDLFTDNVKVLDYGDREVVGYRIRKGGSNE